MRGVRVCLFISLLLLSTSHCLPHTKTQPELERSFKVELEEANLPLKLTENLEKVNEFHFWGVKVYDKRSSTDPFDTDDPSMPRGWGTHHAGTSYHKNSEPLIIGISVVLASVIVFTMFGTIIWRRRRKSKSRTKLKESEGGVDAGQDEPRSTTSFVKKRRNPIKYLKHRKGRKIHLEPSFHSITSPSANNNNDNDSEEERGELLSHSTERNRTSEGDNDNNLDAEQANQGSSSQTHQPHQHSDQHANEHHESPPPFPLDRDTDSGTLPALPPAYRPNSRIPTTSRPPQSTARQTEKSRYINSRGNNELEELQEAPETVNSESEREDGNSTHHLTAHIAVDEKDHLRNLHLASSSPFGEEIDQRRHHPSVPVANVDDDGYEAVEEELWEQPNQTQDEHYEYDTKNRTSSWSMEESNSMPSLPLPPTTFEPTFSPFDLPYSDQLNKDSHIPPTPPSAPSAPPPSSNTQTIEASAPPLDSDDGIP